MAKPKVGSLEERKQQLAAESDTLRYHMSWQCAELAVPAQTALQTLQVANRLRPIFMPGRKKGSRKRSLLLTGGRLLWRLFLR